MAFGTGLVFVIPARLLQAGAAFGKSFHRCPFWFAYKIEGDSWFRWGFLPFTRAIYFSKRPPMQAIPLEIYFGSWDTPSPAENSAPAAAASKHGWAQHIGDPPNGGVPLAL